MSFGSPGAPQKQDVLIVLPVFEEETVIEAFLATLSTALLPLETEYRFRILLVIDPGRDKTEKTIETICAKDPRVGMIVMSRRFGHQAALLAGLDHSRDAAAVIMMDSDGQHPPSLIPEMLARWKAGADIVQTLRLADESQGWFKRLTSGAFYTLMRTLGGIDLQTGGADFRLLDRKVVDVFKQDISERRIFLRGMVVWVGFACVYLPYKPQARITGRTKYRLAQLFELSLVGMFNFTSFPLRLIMISGAVVSFAASLLVVTQLSLYFFVEARHVSGWASLFALVTLFGGLQMLFLGFIGEYVGQIFDEVKRRPRYIVAQSIEPGATVQRAADDTSSRNLSTAHGSSPASQEMRSRPRPVHSIETPHGFPSASENGR